MQQLHCLANSPHGSPLRATLHDAVVLARRLHKLATLEEIVRDRFFDVDILARLHRPDSREGVPMIRCCDDDCLDGLVFEDAAHVGLDFRACLGLLEDPSGGLLSAVAIRIDDDSDLDTFDAGDD